MRQKDIDIELKKITSEIEKLKKKISKLNSKRDNLLSCKTIQCCTSNYGEGCGAKTPLNKLIYIQTHYYVDEPYSEHWECGEGQFDCPKCGIRNRLVDVWGQKGREKFSELSYLFAKVINEYPRD